MDGLDCPVSVPLVHQDGYLDLAGGDHADVDPGTGQCLKHLTGHAGVVHHAGSHDGDLGHLGVHLDGLEADVLPILLQDGSGLLRVAPGHGEADVLAAVAADGLKDDVHIDLLLGQQGEDLKGDPRLIRQRVEMLLCGCFSCHRLRIYDHLKKS